ncbi:hypothetical protein [Streptomyces sp. NPDC005435]|uniref:hypothetical protein n=1 Tax=Streptomyces sp. NPDC005435 TaxID=3154464 RepID=UPI0034539F13
MRAGAAAAAVAAGVIGALVLTGCSGGGGGGGSSDGSATAGATPTASASASGGGAVAAGGVAELQGSWVATGGGRIVALVINGKQAGLFATGGAVCSGTAAKVSGMRMIHLTCKGDAGHRGTGMVDSATKDSLKITWSGGPAKETYTKAEGGALPSGLASGLGQ